jgi:cellulose synthase/poly-beta-1,6-N-acetylglucosamine synthase-like glycosyltransferase
MILQISYWIAGVVLAAVWFSRILEAAIGMPRVADVARPEWDRKPPTPCGEPRISIIVPARNEEHDIRATLEHLLALDYSNYEVIAVDDRSTDGTGKQMDEVAGSYGANTPVRVPSAIPVQSRRIPCGVSSPMRRPSMPTTLSFSRACSWSMPAST